jgi:hypothetical protein
LAFSSEKGLSSFYKGTVLCEGKGLAGVVVTDGTHFCQTDSKGNYSLEVDPLASFIYISSPAGYQVPVENSVPQFHKRIQENNRSGRINFQLKKNNADETKHGFIAWADPQIKASEELPLFKEAVSDLRDLLKLNQQIPFHAIGCGDIVGDNPSLFDSTKHILSETGIPFYQSMGNHDMKYYGRSNETAPVVFEKHFGPAYYSFNKGKIHYVVLNDVFYIGRDYFYIGYLPEQQLAWLEKDLSYIPKGSTVVVTFHIPSALHEDDIKTFEYANISGSMTNKKALYDLLKPYQAHLISGHLHYSRNLAIAPNLYEHIMSSVCGAWWQGPYAEDGTPKGYGVFEANGNQISWYFKSIGKVKVHQFRAYPIGSNPEQPGFITVNVWNWDQEWKIFWYENEQKMGQMESYSGVDPETARSLADKSKLAYKWITARKTEHMFRAKPKDPSAKISVEIIDRFGNIYKENL